jgi:acetyl esterase/lipase
MTGSVTVHNGVVYATHDGVELAGDLYLPKDAKAVPALVAVHGGGWVTGARGVFKYWGDYLAARGIALFSVSYRLAAKEKTFPEAVQDILAGVQFVHSASIRRASGYSVPRRERISRLWPRSATRNSPAAIRAIRLRRSTPA